MTVKDYLDQALMMNQNINIAMEDLGRLRQMSESTPSPGLEEHYNATRNTDAPFVKTMEKIIEREQDINEKIDLFVDLKLQIMSVIDSLSDPTEKRVLGYRYLDGMSWNGIGEKMNADPRTVRRWHSSALTHAALPEDPIII